MTDATISSIPTKVSKQSQALLSATNDSLTRLSKILSTPAGIDKSLLTIYYTLKLLYPQVSRLRSLQARRFISSFLSKARAGLLPGETLITVLEQRDDDFLADLDKSMRNGAALVGDFRIFMRLWGLLGIYQSVRRVYNTPPKDVWTKYMVWGQLGSIGVYQALENVAYLAGKGIFRGDHFTPEKQKTMWLVACRFWTVYVGLEAARLLRDWQLNFTSELSVEEKDGEKGAQRKEAEGAWRRAWYTNAAYSPMTAHFSMESGCLSDDQLGFLGVVIGAIGLRHMWKQAA